MAQVSPQSVEAPGATDNASAPAVQSDVALTSSAKVYIQDKKDKDSTWSNKYGSLSAGDVLWANMYDDVETTDYWGDPDTETKSIANPGTWTYTWLAGTEKSGTIDSFTEEVGHEQSLTVTSDMAGKYLVAVADGGFGDCTSSYVGPAVQPGSVTLYKVEVTGSAKVGATLTATAYKSTYTQVASTDRVRYQWQYADTKTTADSAFKDIAGATGATYQVTDSMVGKYLRVKAISDGIAVSTQKPGSYGSGTTAVDPLGPVTIAGQYALSAVELQNAYSALLQVGATITPQAKVASGYYDKDAPEDAKLTYTWYAKGEGDADWRQVTEGVAANGSLTIGEALVGKSLKVTAYSLDNTVEWASGTTVSPAGQYNLLRVTTTPQSISSSTHVIAGDTVTAQA